MPPGDDPAALLMVSRGSSMYDMTQNGILFRITSLSKMMEVGDGDSEKSSTEALVKLFAVLHI